MAKSDALSYAGRIPAVNHKGRVALSTSLAISSVVFLLLFAILLNGYLLNLTGGYRADAWVVLALVIVECLGVGAAARTLFVIEWDALELAGYLAVVGGVWFYFVWPSLPTWLPPTLSLDAVRHYQHILFTFPEGRLVSWYPAGGAFIGAMASHWLGVDPLRILHPLASAFVALAAGAVFGITRSLLPRARSYSIVAVVSPALLFVPWSYFAGIINWEQYYYAQAVGQYFVLLALWFTVSYAGQPHWTWLVLFGAALLGVVAAYPYLVVLALAAFGIVALARLPASPVAVKARLVAALAVLLALLALAALALQQGGILELRGGQIGAVSDVGEGGVANPSLETLGGPVFLLLALVGLIFAWRNGPRGRAVLAFLAAWAAQWAALVLIQPLFQISGYRVGKTFYLLVYPLAIVATLGPSYVIRRWGERVKWSSQVTGAALAAAAVALVLAVAILRPPVRFAPFTEDELQAARWAKEHLDTYQVSSLDARSIHAYWLAMGLWGETLPNEWFQWIPAGPKLGPPSYEDWLREPAWPRWLLVSDASNVPAASATPVRTAFKSGAAAILEKPALPVTSVVPDRTEQWQFGSTLRLRGINLPRSQLAAGDSMTLTTFIESLRPPMATVGWRMELVNRQNKVVSQATGDPFSGRYPLQRWPPDSESRDVWTLPLGANMPPGGYDLRLGLYRRSDGQEIEASALDAATGTALRGVPPRPFVSLATLKVPIPPPSAEELASARPVDTRIGESILLCKYTLGVDRATRAIHLTLYWQALAKPAADYTVFVHILDGNGEVVAQKDQEPREGASPTSLWEDGEVVVDLYNLVLPADARGPFRVEMGLYQTQTGERLPVVDAAGSALGDHLVLEAYGAGQ